MRLITKIAFFPEHLKHFSEEVANLPFFSCDHILCLLGETAPTAPSIPELHLGEVEERLDAAAQVHDGEDADADLAVELHKGVV